jgi:di/tricarboxylate transporter
MAPLHARLLQIWDIRREFVITLLAIVTAAFVFFIGGWLRVDVVGLLVLSALALTGLVSAQEALAGFSSRGGHRVGHVHPFRGADAHRYRSSPRTAAAALHKA